MEAPFSRYGATAAIAALLTVLASAYLAISGQRCPLPLLIAFYGAGAAEIIVLCRVTVPTWVQGLLILLIIASLTTLTARTDVFGVKTIGAAIPAVQVADAVQKTASVAPGSGGHRSTAASGAGGAGGSGGSGGSDTESGAKVIFAPKDSGDGGWARMLNTAYNRRLGGPQASNLMISGNVGAKRIGKDINVEVRWGISADGVSLQCGSTSAYGSDSSVLSDQFQQGFGQALSRSVELRRASCP